MRRDVAIEASEIVVRYRPYMDRRPTIQRTMSTGRHKRNEVVALDGVTFEVLRGEAFGIIGRNGAGKSTLLRCLAGTLAPDEGRVRVSGKASTLLQLGVGFNPQLAGTTNIILGGLAAGLRKSEIEAKYDDIVEYAELEDAIDRPLKTYSSGMFSRLAFSVAMHLDPEILLLDEVLAVGDRAFREKSLDTMKELLARSGTIVYVSHNVNALAKFCDRTMWLDRGRVRALGESRSVVKQFKAEVAALRKQRESESLKRP